MSNIAIAGIREAKLQGYKQALENVKRLIDKIAKRYYENNNLKELKQQINKLEKTNGKEN